MFILDRMLVGSLTFVLEQIRNAAESELEDPESLRERLLAAQMALELGEIDEEEFAEIEEEILARLRELRQEEAAGPISFDQEDVGVDVTMEGDENGSRPEDA